MYLGTVPKQNRMSISYGCVLAVELYDTIGTADLNIITNLLEVADKSSDSQTGGSL